MSENTPGPWKLDLRSGCLAVYPATEDHNCLSEARNWAIHYAHGYPITRPDGMPAWDIEPEKVANARLIAAAPDLLAACEAAHRALVGWAKDEANADMFPTALFTLNDAIAKARGAQP